MINRYQILLNFNSNHLKKHLNIRFMQQNNSGMFSWLLTTKTSKKEKLNLQIFWNILTILKC